MPNCPSCGKILTMSPRGSECDVCRRHFSVSQTVAMPGYNEEMAMLGSDLIEVLNSLGLPPNLTFEIYLTPDGLLLKEVENAN